MISLNLNNNSIYISPSQKVRVFTESWVVSNVYCPICTSLIIQYPNNHPCGDFFCKSCNEDYDLKSKKNKFGSKIVDGEYSKMIDKINTKLSNFFFLAYRDNAVVNFFTIPKFFFTPFIIEKRKQLSEKARRAGWTECNILYNKLTESAKIFYVKDGEILSEKSVVENYKKVSFVAEKLLESKGWLLNVMFCIENLYCGVGFFNCCVGFPNPTPNVIKSQINKRNVIVYFILLLFF